MTLLPYHPFRSAEARDRFLARYETRAKRWPVPCQERFIDTSFGKTFVRTSGPEDAPPLVLLTGGGGNSLDWMPNVRGLSEVFRIFVPDPFYGFGKSVYTKHPRDGEEYCAWLGEVLDDLGLREGVHLAGLSYGGWVTGEFASRRPERLRSAIMLAPGGVVPLSWVLLARMAVCLIPHPDLTKSFFFWQFADLARQGEEGKKFLEEWSDDFFHAARWFVRMPVANMSLLEDAALAGLRVPMLFVVGENEKCYSPTDAVARLRRVAPKIETVMLEHVGHDLTFAQPNVVNEKIIAFAQRFAGS